MSKYKRYERYKDSGVEWIGEIPEEWNVVRLKFLKAKPFLYGANETAELEEPELPRYIRITDIDSNGNLREDIFKSLPWEIAKPYLLKEGDILFARSGATVGKTFLYKKSWGVACFAGYLIKFEANTNKVIPKYVYYYTLSWQYENWVKQSTIQATIQNVSAEKYGNLLIPLPLVQQQKMIVDFLDQKTVEIDNLIADKEKLIELLQEKRQAIITEAVTKGLNPNVGMRDSGVEWIGEIPEHWGVSKIKYTTYVKGRIGWQGLRADEFIDEGPYLVTGTDFVDGLVNWDSCYHISMERYNEAPSIQLRENDLLITKDGTIGKVAIVKNKPKYAILNSGIFVVRSLKSAYLTEFMYWILNSQVFKRFIEYMSLGSTIVHLYQQTFENFSFPIPDLSEQKAIAIFLNQKIAEIDGLITDINTQIQKLKEYRQSLISEAVTGKIDVRGYDVNN
jgi:type I restriction enzyme S subunit